MKLKFYLVLSCLVAGLRQTATAQTAADYALQLQASVQTAPPKITLSWRKIAGTTQYNLQRKTKAALVWTSLATTVDTFYNDATVTTDTTYEYRVFNTGSAAIGGGYVFAGINAPAIHEKGTLVMVVDTLIKNSCPNELSQFMKDLSADGWAILQHDVNRAMTDLMVKSLIKSDYSSQPDVKAVMLIGHVAVPYSGDLNPDAHPDHLGAWPADVFYGDMDGTWTDAGVTDTAASRPQNRNKPGDGKWDQTAIASAIELQVSRIDLSDMPAFAKSEADLMRSYFAKAHLYKMDSLYISRKAVIDDNFGAFSGEAFAANGWRNFPQLLSRNNIIAGDFISSLNDSAYQWGYGCGGGSYTSCGGVGVSADFTTNNQKGIFTMLFGSYFGDWDNQNNFLRAPLCSKEPALTSCWAGRPNWFFHHMALGENIGYSTRMTHNYNNSLYLPGNYMATAVHVALMGDLSLRSDYIKPARNILLNHRTKGGMDISWTSSPDAAVLGYYVYRAESMYGKYNRLSGLIPGTNYSDTAGKNALHYYMVRPVKLQTTPSGTYYNLGLGITDSATVTFPIPANIASAGLINATMLCFPNPSSGILNIYNHVNISKGKAVLSILDATGKLMIEKRFSLTQNEFTVSEDIGDFAGGIYFVQMKIEDKIVAVQKVIKQ